MNLWDHTKRSGRYHWVFKTVNSSKIGLIGSVSVVRSASKGVHPYIGENEVRKLIGNEYVFGFSILVFAHDTTDIIHRFPALKD